MEAEFPFVKVAFATVNMKPRILAIAVRIDFTDYDLLPLSVKFIDPFEDRELSVAELHTRLPRIDPTVPPAPFAQQGLIPTQLLIQAYGNEPGFLCVAGVREYHANPAHTGDPWELRRANGEGKLFRILEVIWRYGASQLTQLQFQIGIIFQQNEFPS
jgi:hypothetical protein